jgi:hypothetical protein
MTRILPLLLSLFWLISGHPASASEFHHIGDYLLKSRTRLTGEKISPVNIKPMLLHVFTDGVQIRITAENDEDACSNFEIYRSDGIGRQRSAGGALEVIPGVQAFSRNGTCGFPESHSRLPCSREFPTRHSSPMRSR